MRVFMRYIIFLILIVAVANSQTIRQGQTIDIDSCDEHKWCKISDTDRYVKGFKFKATADGFELKPQFKEALTYRQTTTGENFGYEPITNNRTTPSRPISQPDETTFGDVSALPKPKKQQGKDIYKLNEIRHGDVLYIERCDEQNYCKIKNSKYYIKGDMFDKEGERYTLKDRYAKSYYYWNTRDSAIIYKKVLKKGNPNKKYRKSTKVIKQKQTRTDEFVNQRKIDDNKNDEEVFNIMFFVQFGAGLSKIYPKTDLPKRFLEDKLDDTGIALDIAVGVESKSFFATANYGYMTYDNIKMDNLYGTINYKFNNNDISPYIGLMAGQGNFKWDKTPLANSRDEKLSTESSVSGLQIGANKLLTKNLYLNLNLQHIRYDYTTNINDGEFYIEHKTQNNLTIGVKYVF